MSKPKYMYEVLWYEGTDEDDALQHDPETKEFTSREAAMNFYNKHKDDSNKFMFWVTKRDEDWCVVEDIII